MEKFILTGKKTSLGIILELKIPSKKIYDDGSKTVRRILRAENNDIGCDEDIYDSLYPYRSPVTLRSELLSFAGFGFMFGSHTVANPNILDHIYSKHNYPLATLAQSKPYSLHTSSFINQVFCDPPLTRV